MCLIRALPVTNGDTQVSSPSPTVRRRRLGIELRRLREQAALTCERVGERLECSGTRISRIETGRISVRPGDVREMLELYDVSDDEAGALAQLAREARRKGWWHAYGRVYPDWLESYIGLESEAIRLRDFQPLVLPGHGSCFALVGNPEAMGEIEIILGGVWTPQPLRYVVRRGPALQAARHFMQTGQMTGQQEWEKP